MPLYAYTQGVRMDSSRTRARDVNIRLGAAATDIMIGPPPLRDAEQGLPTQKASYD